MFFIGIFNNVHATVNETVQKHLHTTAICINRETLGKQCRLS